MTLFEFWRDQKAAALEIFENKKSFMEMINEYQRLEPKKDIQKEMETLNNFINSL